jgi:pilus assembly protein Flp/PilA
MFRKFFKSKNGRKGAAMIEYALLVGGIALICAGAVSLFGHKTDDIIATVAAIIPGAHTDDNAPIISGKLIETAPQKNAAGSTGIALDFNSISSQVGTDRLGINIVGTGLAAGNGLGGLILEAH